MANKPIGQTFYAELLAAGAALDGVSWIPSSGVIMFDPSCSAAQIAAVEAVYAAHDPTTPANAMAGVIDQVDALCTSKLAVGYSDTGPGGTGKVFQTDDVSRANFTGAASACLAAIATNNPMTFDLIPADNQTITGLSAPACLAILMRMFGWVSATIIYARALKNEILAGQTPDITAGWPS